jgi:hypothetical protein
VLLQRMPTPFVLQPQLFDVLACDKIAGRFNYRR